MEKNIEILEQGSAHAGPLEGHVTVDEVHKVAVDDVLQVYLPEQTVPNDEAGEVGLTGASKAKPKTEPPPPGTLAERIDAVASHEEANALADELGVEGFETKKPNLDDKRAALHEKAKEANDDAEVV